MSPWPAPPQEWPLSSQAPTPPAQLSRGGEGVNSQQLLPRCRFWNSHLCNNKPRGKRCCWGVALSPLAPHSEPACGCQGAAGEGWQPRCCGILPPDSQRNELGAAEEPACFPQHFPFSLLLAPTVLGHPAGSWGGAAERVPPSGAGLGCNWFQERGVRRDGHKFP